MKIRGITPMTDQCSLSVHFLGLSTAASSFCLSLFPLSLFFNINKQHQQMSTPDPEIDISASSVRKLTQIAVGMASVWPVSDVKHLEPLYSTLV